VQTLFESSTSDVLLLLDCCAAASSAPRGGVALTETIAACGWENIAAEPGRFSFTNALIEVLNNWVGRTFSAAMLHSQVLRVLKRERPELLGGTHPVECRRTPVYIMTTNNPQASSINLSFLAPLVDEENNRPTTTEATMEWEGTPHGLPNAVHKPAEKRKRRRKSDSVDSESPIKRFKGKAAEESSVPEETSVMLNAAATSSIMQLPSPPEEYDVESIQSVTSKGEFRVPHVLISIALT